MDKEKIHIDDLVRGQFTGREEEERPGAWLHMRELLDKQMPAGRPVPFFGWRRLAGYMLLLSVTAALTVGGYNYYNHQTESGQVAAAAERTSDAGSGTASAGNAWSGQVAGGPEAGRDIPEAYEGPSVSETGINQANIPRAELPSEPAKGDSRTVAAVHPQQNPEMHSADAGSAASGGMRKASRAAEADHGMGAGPQVAGDVAGSPSATADQTGATTRSGTAAHRMPVVTPVSDAGRHTAAAGSQISGRSVTTSVAPAVSAAGTADKHHQSRSQASSPQATAPGSALQENPAIARADQQPAGAGGGRPAVSSVERVLVQRDTIEKINLVYRTEINPLSRSRVTRVDTASVEMLVVERRMPVLIQEPVADPSLQQRRARKTTRSSAVASGIPAATQPASGKAVVSPAAVSPKIAAAPEASAPQTGANMQTAVQVAARKSVKKKGWDPHRFEDMYTEAKFNLSQAQFHPGITGGINAMFSGGTFMPGIQLGFTGEIVFNDRWSIMTELKYITRFSNNIIIEDNYVSEPHQYPPYAPVVLYHNGQPDPVATVYIRDSVIHSFNFSTLGTLDLPISIRYAINRFFVAAGIDLVHHFRINAEEVSQQPIRIRDTVAMGASLPANWENSSQKVHLNDLAARFGLGYMIGMGYRVTPDFHLDLRMTHMVADNSRTGGSRTVSNQLFRAPNVQFSLNYRLGSRRQAP